MQLHKETYNVQSELARYCRTGDLKPIKGANPDRLKHYRRLVFNVVNGVLETAYPITKQILKTEEWDLLVSRFFSEHDTVDPQVWKMPYEFYNYVLETGFAEQMNRPYLNDLLHFEWIEIEVHTMPDKKIPLFKEKGTLLKEKIIINPEHKLLKLSFPVFRLSADHLKENEGEYYVLVYRDQAKYDVHFFEMSTGYVVLFELLKTNDLNGRQALEKTAKLMQLPNKDSFWKVGESFLKDLLTRQIVLGFKAS